MSNTSLFTFVDQLLAKIRALPECASPVEVYDGIPGGGDTPVLFVQVGGDIEPDVASMERWAQLGAGAKWEEYDVRCYIRSWAGGDADSATTTDDAQKEARDAAIVVFKAIETALRADINFSAANGGFPLILWCEVTDIRVKQTPVNPSDDGSKGRGCQIGFTVHVKNRF